MAVKKTKTIFECKACGHKEAKWLGRCPSCGEWNSLKEVENLQSKENLISSGKFSIPLEAINTEEGVRYSSGSIEVDRVLGGGIMRGSSVLIAGEPGIGKSTLLLEIAAKAEIKGRALYISGEESAAHIKLRADRLGLKNKNIEVMCTGSLDEALMALERVKPDLFVVDSLQTLRAADAGTIPGTANQVKYCALELADWARERGSACFLVAHVTKDGLIAGPKAAEHTVDVVLLFEQSDSDIRFLRSAKNRFGSIDELGLFTMTEKGLAELSDPSGIFMEHRESGPPAGTAITVSWEGTRAFLVEIQALTVASKASLSRVYSERIEPARVARIAAVLEKHAKLVFSDQDIYVNVSGGIRLTEPGVDLALAASLYSARTGVALPKDIALFGELTLAGELRPVRRMLGRTRAAKAMGLNRVIGPPENGSETGRKTGKPNESEDSWEEKHNITNAVKSIFLT